jgi:hypothetical protein
MKKGILIFAFNTESVNYFKMALYTSKRVNKFLNLPVTIVSDINSISEHDNNVNIVITEPNKSNYRDKLVWINKNRYTAYDYTPYDDTIVLDSDYMINSTVLNTLFDYDSDFIAYYNSKYLFNNVLSERLHKNGLQSYWATVIRFRKTNYSKNIFSMMNMVQDNNEHYSRIYKYMPYMYRNDYSLTVALHTINNNIVTTDHNIYGSLLHIDKSVYVERLSDVEYKVCKNTESSKQYIIVKDTDFHMMSKTNFMELINE